MSKFSSLDEQGNCRCYFCDGIVEHDSSEMAEDIYPGEYGSEDVVHRMVCQSCGAEYEIIQKFPDND